jgi:SAM-dependent methyltransferase
MWKSFICFSEKVIKEHRQQADSTTLYRCPNCELGIFLPQIIGTPTFYQELGAISDGVYGIEDRWEFDEALKDGVGWRSIIEIGSGTGAYLDRAVKTADAVGIEYNPDAVAQLRAKGLCVYGVDDQQELTDRKGQFDAAFSFQVLEHVADPVAFVEACKDWVRPGGMIGLCVPNSAGIMRHYRRNMFDLPPHHATRWSSRTLTVLAERLGLHIERIAYQPLYHYHYPYVIWWWKDIIRGESYFRRALRGRGTNVLSHMSQLLLRLGIKRLPLRGHSVYVLMTLPEKARDDC